MSKKSTKAGTPNYDLYQDTEDDFYDVEGVSKSFFKVDTELKKHEEGVAENTKQITDCLGEIGKVKDQITGIDVTTDMEDVVTRLVNSDRSTSLNTLINNVKTAITNSITAAKDVILSRITEINNAIIAHVSSAVNAARDVVTSHVTSQHTTTKGHVTTKAVEINNYTLARANEIKTAINGKPSGAVKSVQRGVYTTPNSNSTLPINIPISTVNPAKCSVNVLGKVTQSSSNHYNVIVSSLESTSLKIDSYYAIIPTTSSKISWEVVEFY